jgi:hypothetical protein
MATMVYNHAFKSLCILWCNHFFYKKYILISRRYQLHPFFAIMHCPIGITDEEPIEKKELQKEKVLLQ